jgi:hypothetical protein
MNTVGYARRWRGSLVIRGVPRVCWAVPLLIGGSDVRIMMKLRGEVALQCMISLASSADY